MGHMVGKDVYRRLGKKIDNLTTRVPWNETFCAILKELYTTEEADLVARMPYGLATLDQIARVTGYERGRLRSLLDSLCSKGLVLDIGAKGRYHYMVSPLVIGIFEFTMMRTGGQLNTKEWARLFHTYLQQPDTFYRANCGAGQKVSPLRALPHEGTVEESEFVEVLDYEKATSIVEEADKFAIGICSCRHEKLHVGEKPCDAPLETCSTLGVSADVLIRHEFAKEVSRTEMLENLARSRQMRLVFCADNVRRNISFICHCCGCCCNVLLGVSRFGYPNVIVTSNYIARVDQEACSQCGVCVESCPIGAITMPEDGDPAATHHAPLSSRHDPDSSRHEPDFSCHDPLSSRHSRAGGNPGNPEIDENVCLGCGVCVLDCSTESLKLKPRDQRVLHPEDTFERVILQSLERGTLQNLLFTNPQSASHGFMRAFVGGFLKLPPVKRSLMSDTLRSRFLTFMRRGG